MLGLDTHLPLKVEQHVIRQASEDDFPERRAVVKNRLVFGNKGVPILLFIHEDRTKIVHVRGERQRVAEVVILRAFCTFSSTAAIRRAR